MLDKCRYERQAKDADKLEPKGTVAHVMRNELVEELIIEP